MNPRDEHDRDERDLDRLVDETLTTGGRSPAAGGGRTDDPWREVAQRLRALADEPLPATTRDRHLARLRQTPAEATPAAGRRRPWRRGHLPRRLVPVAAAMLLLLVVSGGGAVAVAQDATPDDPLYGIKRASEEVWAAMPRDSERAAQVQLTLAMRRHGEAMRAPGHAEQLLAAGAENAGNAADELPEEAFRTFQRLLGRTDEPGLPSHASPRAHAAIHRNCERLADRHGFDERDCGDPPDDVHPGRGAGRDGHPGGPHGRADDQRPGWGPGGRPEGHEGPPPWAPGADRGEGDDEPDEDPDEQ